MSSRKDELRCALIGCGVISSTHLDSVDRIDGARWVALCDEQEDRLQKAGEGREHLFLTRDHREILDPDRVDVIFVLTEHHRHGDLVREAIEAGIDVLCEKPLTAHPEDLKSLLEVHRQHPEVVVGGIFQNRYHPSFAQLRELMEEGRLGTVLNMSLDHRCLRTSDYYLKDEWRGTWKEEGGSCLINQSIHFLDYLIQLGGEVSELMAYGANRVHGELLETEDSLAALIRFSGGIPAVFTCTNGSVQGWTYRLHVVGDQASAELVDGKLSILGNDDLADSLQSEEQTNKGPGKSYYGGHHQKNIEDFLETVRQRTRPTITLESQARTTHMVHQLYRSWKQGRPLAPEDWISKP